MRSLLALVVATASTSMACSSVRPNGPDGSTSDVATTETSTNDAADAPASDVTMDTATADAADEGSTIDAGDDTNTPDTSFVDASADSSDVTDGGLTTLFGSAFSPTNDTRYDEIDTLFGAIQVRRSYDNASGVMPFLNTYQAQDVARGAASAYSFKYTPSEVIAGMHDTEIQSFFMGIRADHPVFWTYWHEPDDELYVRHTFTPTDYRAAWAHIRAIADSVRATRPRLVVYATLIIMEYSMRPAIAPSRPLLGANGMYPGDDVIDVFGVDAYNAAADSGGETDPMMQFGKVIDFAEAHHKRWAIGEFGSCPVMGDANGRTTYITNAVRYWISRGNPPAYAAWFNVDWPTCDYRIDTDAPARMRWHDAVTRGLSAF